jgi:hypothetical protein
MRRWILGILALLAFEQVAQAQFVTVNATVLDPNGIPYAGGRGNVDFVPSPSATQVPLLSGSTFQTSFTIASLDSFGAFTLAGLADNNLITDGHSSPPASKWHFSIVSQDGKTAFGCTITITGVTQNISAALQACAAPFPSSVASAASLLGPGSISGTFSGNHTLTGNETTQGNDIHNGTETFSGPINGSAKWVDVIGGTPDPLANVNTVLNTKLYSTNPLTMPQATYFSQIDISGSHAGAPLSFGADFGQFIQFRVHDTTGTWPSFWEGDAIEAEAEAFGSMAIALPNYRLCALCGQTFIDDKGTDSIVVPFASDIISRGPFRNTSAVSRPGTMAGINGNTAVTGAGGTNLVAGDVGKLLWVDAAGNGSQALSVGTIQSVNVGAQTLALTSGWTWITTTAGWWQTTAVGATGPDGSTSSIGSAYSATLTQPIVGSNENLALRIGGVAGHPEESIQGVFDNLAIHQWAYGLQNNSNTQSNDFIVKNFITNANAIFLRFRTPGNDGASQRGDSYLNASGVNGRMNFNWMPTFAGEGPPTNVGTGGSCFGAGGSAAAMAAAPCGTTGVISIPFGGVFTARNSGNTNDIQLIQSLGVNSVQVGDAVNTNFIQLFSASGVTLNHTVTPNVAAVANLGTSLLPFLNLCLGTAATNNFCTSVAATAAAHTIAYPDPGTATTLTSGLSYNSTIGYYVTKRATGGCTTAASIGGVCAAPITVTWGPTLPNTNYSVVCTPNGAATNLPSSPYWTAKTATTATINYFAITAAAASWPSVDCMAILD